MSNASCDKTIKSADRVLQTLELFTKDRQSITVMEVARRLEMPQSSTSELLGSLVRRGYLVRDRGGRVFRPTARIALLGAWVEPTLFRHGSLLPMMDALHEQSGAAVVLGSQVGVALHHLHVVGDPAPAELGTGAVRHLLHSPFGHTLLLPMFLEDVRKLVHRLNSESAPEQRVRIADLIEQIEAVGRRGYALRKVAPGWTGVAMLLPKGASDQALSIGIIGRTASVEPRREELVRLLRQGISHHLGPRLASDAGDREPARYAGLVG